jgi:hypothetical protein
VNAWCGGYGGSDRSFVHVLERVKKVEERSMWGANALS